MLLTLESSLKISFDVRRRKYFRGKAIQTYFVHSCCAHISSVNILTLFFPYCVWSSKLSSQSCAEPRLSFCYGNKIISLQFSKYRIVCFFAVSEHIFISNITSSIKSLNIKSILIINQFSFLV